MTRYFPAFAGLTMLSFGSAIFLWRSSSCAKWIASLNAPGVFFVAYVVVPSYRFSILAGGISLSLTATLVARRCFDTSRLTAAAIGVLSSSVGFAVVMPFICLLPPPLGLANKLEDPIAFVAFRIMYEACAGFACGLSAASVYGLCCLGRFGLHHLARFVVESRR